MAFRKAPPPILKTPGRCLKTSITDFKHPGVSPNLGFSKRYKAPHSHLRKLATTTTKNRQINFYIRSPLNILHIVKFRRYLKIFEDKFAISKPLHYAIVRHYYLAGKLSFKHTFLG